MQLGAIVESPIRTHSSKESAHTGIHRKTIEEEQILIAEGSFQLMIFLDPAEVHVFADSVLVHGAKLKQRRRQQVDSYCIWHPQTGMKFDDSLVV